MSQKAPTKYYAVYLPPGTYEVYESEGTNASEKVKLRCEGIQNAKQQVFWTLDLAKEFLEEIKEVEQQRHVETKIIWDEEVNYNDFYYFLKKIVDGVQE